MGSSSKVGVFVMPAGLLRLPQACITPYTPEQHGLIERWFRSLKEECVWHHQFRNFADARTTIAQWIAWS